MYVHEKCRKNHSNARRFEQMKQKRENEVDSRKKPNLRSEKLQFSFANDCFICGECVDKEKAKRYPDNPDAEYSNVMTVPISKTIEGRCNERRQGGRIDKWADEVAQRIACTNDLPAEEAIYHRKCFCYFMNSTSSIVVTLSSNLKQLVQDAHKKLEKDWEDMDMLIEIVGNYIRNEIKSLKKHNDVYRFKLDYV
jgi:hypothetical protein